MLLVTRVFASVDIAWSNIDYPEIAYLYRDHGSEFGTKKENALSKRKSFESVKSLLKEARTLNVRVVTPVFFRFDLQAGKVVEGGLEILNKRSASMIQKTRIRPAGKFLRASYQGNDSGMESVFRELPGKLKEGSFKLMRQEAYYQKVTGSGKDPNAIIILFPLKEK